MTDQPTGTRPEIDREVATLIDVTLNHKFVSSRVHQVAMSLTARLATAAPAPPDDVRERVAIRGVLADELWRLSYHPPLTLNDKPYRSGHSINSLSDALADAVLAALADARPGEGSE